MSREVIIDECTADAYDLSVNDTIYVGGTTAAAADNEFTVVGISPTFSEFLGAPTITVRLSELQTLTGATGTDPATMITITLEDGAEPVAVQDDLQADYPEYDVRTNREQLEAVVGEQATVLVGAGLLVAVAFLTGTALTVSLLALFVYQSRAKLATLAALGVSRPTVVAFIVAQGVLLGAAGWLLGAALTVPLAQILNTIVAAVVGFDGLVVVAPEAIAASAVLAIGIGTLASAVAVWRLPADFDANALRS
ncbi:ABC transporter permease [Natrialbaceae archaeon GCM10025810]|uniref:ABC transporter permease n=1 Tax=Halovalidus salilacus TaxID=3075124 RepID=UPI00361EDFCB